MPSSAPSHTASLQAAEDRRLKLIGLLVTAGAFGALYFVGTALADKWSLGFRYVLPLTACRSLRWRAAGKALSILPRQRVVIAVLGGAAVAPELVSRLTPVLGSSLTAALPERMPGWRLLAAPRASRRIGGLVCFDANERACR